MELIVPTPEREALIAEHGLKAFIKDRIIGISMFYMIYNLIGSLIFLTKNFKWKKMLLLSFTLGFILEFLLMKPDWVQNILILKIRLDVIVAVIVSALYWFGSWGVPVYILKRYILKNR